MTRCCLGALHRTPCVSCDDPRVDILSSILQAREPGHRQLSDSLQVQQLVSGWDRAWRGSMFRCVLCHTALSL